MTPKERAEELIGIYRKELLKRKYHISGFVIQEIAEQCALIAVDEIFSNNTDESKHDYWIEVKQEIDKL